MESLLSPKQCWQYTYCNNSQLSDPQINQYHSKGKLKDDITYFYDYLGSAIHPSLIRSDILNLPEEDTTIPSTQQIKFNNIMVDYCTIQIVFSFLPRTRIVELTFQSNSFDDRNLELLCKYLFTRPNNIYSLNFIWNDYVMINKKKIPFSLPSTKFPSYTESDIGLLKKSQELLTGLFSVNVGNKLEAINLRGNYLGDGVISTIFNNLKENNTLKVLNLFKNNITNKSCDALCQMLLFNRTLQEINLGGNNISNETIGKLKDFTGSYIMSDEEIDTHKKKIKSRDDIIAQNKKNKGSKKPILEVPFVDEILAVDQDTYKIRNNKLRKIDIMGNKDINQKSLDSILYILDHNIDLIFVLDLYNFDKESLRQIMSPESKYCNQIYLAN